MHHSCLALPKHFLVDIHFSLHRSWVVSADPWKYLKNRRCRFWLLVWLLKRASFFSLQTNKYTFYYFIIGKLFRQVFDHPLLILLLVEDRQNLENRRDLRPSQGGVVLSLSGNRREWQLGGRAPEPNEGYGGYESFLRQGARDRRGDPWTGSDRRSGFLPPCDRGRVGGRVGNLTLRV